MIKLNKWLVLKATPRLILLVALLALPGRLVHAAVVKDLRIGSNEGYVRLVLEFDRPQRPVPSFSLNQNHLQINLGGILNNLSTPPAADQQDGISRLSVSNASGEITIEAAFDFTPVDIQSFALTGPHRFIIDAYRPPPNAPTGRSMNAAADISSPEKGDALPEAYGRPRNHASTGMSDAIVRASMDAYGAIASNHSDGHLHAERSQFQQRLIAALIVVTSIIVVLLFFLIWIGANGGDRQKRPWRKHLPPVDDPTIRCIDAVIREHLKTYDTTDQVPSCPKSD